MRSTALTQQLCDFFENYLPQVREYSRNTILSYQDTFRLLMDYMESKRKIKPYSLDYKHLSDDVILDFLKWLRTERNCSASTCNQRMTAISSFFKYASRKNIAALKICNQLLDLPTKKAHHNLLSYFTVEEMQVLLQMPNPQRKLDRRDLVLLSLLYDSGARAQEICNLKTGDIRFSRPAAIRLLGKGEKTRIVPLTEKPAQMARQFISELNRSQKADSNTLLFSSQTNKPITPACVRYLLSKYVAKAKATRPDLFQADAYSPHSIRHSKAVHMLEAGVDLIYIRDFLGHVSVQTTEIYATVSSALVDKALRERKIPEVTTDRLPMPVPDKNIPGFLKRQPR